MTAKRFVFQLLYGGTAYGFSQKADFQHVSKSPNFWQNVIDAFYTKYKGIHAWHERLMEEARKTGKIVLPNGREYDFQPLIFNGEHKWPRTKILNYPVQGLGADLVCIGRVTCAKRLKKLGIPLLWQSTVHDSIDIDAPKESVYNICKVVSESFSDVPINFYRLFGVEFNLPIRCEISVGPNLGALEPWHIK